MLPIICAIYFTFSELLFHQYLKYDDPFGNGPSRSPRTGRGMPVAKWSEAGCSAALVMETTRNGQRDSVERRPSHHEPGRHPGYSATVASSDFRSSNGSSIGTAAGSGSNRGRARARPSPSPCRPREAWFWSAGPRQSRSAGAQCRRRARHFLACGRKKSSEPEHIRDIGEWTSP